jgi:hypothetical protein
VEGDVKRGALLKEEKKLALRAGVKEDIKKVVSRK